MYVICLCHSSLGLNAHLVEVCVEYLQQPLALREEGIFRVPGDSSVIRSLHADFMTVGQDPDKLKYTCTCIYVWVITQQKVISDL